MPKLFGTDGIRGEAGKFPLDTATVGLIGRVLARQLAIISGVRSPRLVTGRDTRESGVWLEQAMISGAREGGAECESAGVITTPGVAYLARSLPADAGVVITASHNPYQDNGIKIFTPSGRKLNDATERIIEKNVDAETSANPIASNPVQIERLIELENTPDSRRDSEHPALLQAEYVDYLVNEIANGLSLTGLRIAVDCANGAASNIAPKVLESLGARVFPINNSPNGRNINLNCGSLHIDGLQNRVVETHADIGVAFDGDADRALFVDASGRFVDGDATLWVLAKQLHSKGVLKNETVVATVMSNIGLEIALRSLGTSMLRTDVGDKFVLEKLLESGSSIGGEQSGHIIFPHVSLVGDGIVTMLRVLEVMQETRNSLATLTEGFTRYPQVLINVPVREKRPFAEVTAIASAAREVEKELAGNGRLLLRYSGTEPLARVMIEGEQMEMIERSAKAIATVIRSALGTS